MAVFGNLWDLWKHWNQLESNQNQKLFMEIDKICKNQQTCIHMLRTYEINKDRHKISTPMGRFEYQ